MADISWPDGLPGPKVSGTSVQTTPGFTESQLASGPSFIQPFSSDTPIFVSVSYQFKRGDARRFELWLRENDFKTYNPFFDGPFITPNRLDATQECRYTYDGFPQLTGVTAGGVFTYSAEILIRKPVYSDDDYTTVADSMWGTNDGNAAYGFSVLDEGLNG